MAKPRVFIDGQAGTIGLRIRDLLKRRSDLDLLAIDPSRRKDPAARAELLNTADIDILCLPDDAAREAVALIEHPHVRVIDGSTAHRTTEGWVYGLPELAPDQRPRIASAARVANPGCYPTGVILLVRPLVDAGVLPAEFPLTVHALSGYTGGGNGMIARWEDPDGPVQRLPYEAPYALDRRHKHIDEMMRYAGLTTEPHFVPAVGSFRCGMRIEIPLHAALLGEDDPANAIFEVLRQRYASEPLVNVLPIDRVLPIDEHSFDPRACNDENRVELRVLAHPSGHVLLVALLDNLGKGAAGAAVQSLNVMLDLPEDAGL